jgi:hypothetical protein
MKAQMLVLHTGYVESNSTGCLILWHPIGFDTVEDAIESLAAVFKDVWEENRERAVRSAKSYNRCPHCDEPLIEEDPMQAEDVAALVDDYLGGVADGSHSVWEALQNYGWQTGLYDAPREMLPDAVIVSEHAGAIIGIVAAEDPGEYLEYIEDWKGHMKVPDGIVLRRPTTETDA